MNYEKNGNDILFFDTYSFIEISKGNESYQKYIKNYSVITTIMNLYELYYKLMQAGQETEAEILFEKFLPNCVEIKPGIVKEASAFKLTNKKLDVSYIDALGYITAKRHSVKFLTGDEAFRKMENVEFVK